MWIHNINTVKGSRLSLPFADSIISVRCPRGDREGTHILSMSCQTQIRLAKWNNPCQLWLHSVCQDSNNNTHTQTQTHTAQRVNEHPHIHVTVETEEDEQEFSSPQIISDYSLLLDASEVCGAKSFTFKQTKNIMLHNESINSEAGRLENGPNEQLTGCERLGQGCTII